jgi:two-component system, sensor histidine kinase and response regulator
MHAKKRIYSCKTKLLKHIVLVFKILMIPKLQKASTYLYAIKKIGYQSSMNEFEKRRLGIFNIMNFLGMITGIIIPIAVLGGDGNFPAIAMVVACAPFFISALVLFCNYYHQHQLAIVCYFILYPAITSLVYVGGIDVGIELLFILYAVLAVFFLQNIRVILVTVGFSIACYLFTYTLHGRYNFIMRDVNLAFYLCNQFLSIFFIFLGLILIKKENNAYQLQLSTTNNKLVFLNTEMKKRKVELTEKNYLLEEQTEQLGELNALKNRMFSIISHDLKNPIYSLRNLFRNVQQYDLPGEEIKVLVPDIINDLNYTTSLMDNLLQWAKSQMEGSSVNPQKVDISKMIIETQNLLRLQAESKAIFLNTKTAPDTFIYADKDMITLVLRNLLSNAIKFTPKDGEIQVGTTVKDDMVEIYVKDSGIGISKENMEKLFGGNYYSTNGTANESGTGLGLMLCKEFLKKNGGDIHVESEEGKGSKFIFNIPTSIN